MLLSQSNATPIHDLEQLGAALRDARRSLGLTQVDAAQLSGVSPRRERALGRRYDARRNCATCSTVMLAYDFHAGRGPIWMTTSMSSALRNRPRRS